MVIPDAKQALLGEAQEEVQRVVDQYQEGLITDGERYNKIVDIWAGVADKVTQEMMLVIGKEKVVDRGDRQGVTSSRASTPSTSWPTRARAGPRSRSASSPAMRGLMAKPSGEIIETPITANFREGLTVLQYFISTHGARKGLADTALKTANSGYLTRRLVDVAQDAVIAEFDCGTLDGIRVTKLEDAGEVIQPLGDRILGRVALEDIVDPLTGEVLVAAEHGARRALVKNIEDAGIEEVVIRSVLTCQTKRGVCANCYGRDLARGYKVNIGEAVGIIASQSIGEPGTQLTMRTFHIGGAAARGKIEQSSLEARNEGYVRIRNANIAKKHDGTVIVMNRHGEIVIVDDTGREREHHRLVYGALLKVKEGDKVKAGQLLAEWDAFAMPILTEVGGIVKFGDIVEGVTMTEKLDEVTGLSRKVIIESQRGRSRGRASPSRTRRRARRSSSRTATLDARYLLPVGANIVVQDGDESSAGDVLAKIPRETTKTQDITGGLPRVAELFEARKPKDHAIIAEIDGEVTFGKDTKGKRKVVITPFAPDGAPLTDQAREYLIPKGKHIQVQPGDRVRAGEPLMDGPANPHDILRVKGEKELAAYLVNEIQQVYRLQGVAINDKHIEVIVRQMLRRVRIKDVGDTNFLIDEQVEKHIFETREPARHRARRHARHRRAAAPRHHEGEPLDRVVHQRALASRRPPRCSPRPRSPGKTDHLRGLKENVIMGRLIPAGTGLAPTSSSRWSSKATTSALRPAAARRAGHDGGRERGVNERRRLKAPPGERETAALSEEQGGCDAVRGSGRRATPRPPRGPSGGPGRRPSASRRGPGSAGLARGGAARAPRAARVPRGGSVRGRPHPAP